MNNNSRCAKRNAPFERGAWECVAIYSDHSTPCKCRTEAALANRRQDERDARTDLLSSLQIPLGYAARRIFAEQARSLRRCDLISAREKRELLALFGCGGAR